MSTHLFNDDGSLMGQIDHNTHQMFDSNHNHVATVDHLHHSINDIHGQTMLHHDVNSGNLFDQNHSMAGSIQHQSGFPANDTQIADTSGHVTSHISAAGDVTNAAGHHIGSVKNEW